jgi:hypothetical protein
MRRDLDFLEAIVTKPIACPFGELSIARRSGEVRLAGEESMRVPDAIGSREGEKSALEIRVCRATLARKPEQLGAGPLGRGAQERREGGYEENED